MSTFKKYLLKCIVENSEVEIKRKHMKTMTFEDICMLVYYLEDYSMWAYLSEELFPESVREKYFENGTIYFDGKMTEKLAILICICGRDNFEHDWVELIDSNTGKEYSMSGDFMEMAANCGMTGNPAIQYIQLKLRINCKVSLADEYFERYCWSRSVKSARNTG